MGYSGNKALRVAGITLVVLLLALLGRESAIHSIDFPVYHRAARQLLSGHFELYPPEAYAGNPGPSQGFRYAPVIAVLFVPFGWPSLPLAALAFFLLKLLALWYIGSVIARHAGARPTPQLIGLAALVVAGYLVEEFRFGNAHFLCMALMVFAYDRSESERVVAPAVALALAILMKVTPITLLAYFAFRRRLALCAATVAAVVILLAAPAAVVGVQANSRELRAFTTYALEKIDEIDNQSLRGALERYLIAGRSDTSHLDASVANLDPAVVNGLWLIGLGMLAVWGLSALWPPSGDRLVRLLEFSIVMTGIVLASPHTQRRYFVALFVPAVVLVALRSAPFPEQDKQRLQIGLLSMALPSTILPLVFGGRTLALLYEAASPYLFGALVLFGVLIAATRDLKRREPSVSESGDARTQQRRNART
jgi:hypothetical protein